MAAIPSLPQIGGNKSTCDADIAETDRKLAPKREPHRRSSPLLAPVWARRSGVRLQPLGYV